MSRKRFSCLGRNVIDEFVTFALWHAVRCSGWFARRCAWLVPRLSSIIGALNDLSEPTACLRCVNPARIHRRTFHVVNLPAGKMRPANLPPLAVTVRGQDERTFACAN